MTDTTNTIPQQKIIIINENEEQENVGDLDVASWPTPADSKRPKRATRMKIEGSCRSTPIHKKGTSFQRKKETLTKALSLSLNMTRKVYIKRVERHEGHPKG